jgi:hypothetical protein
VRVTVCNIYDRMTQTKEHDAKTQRFQRLWTDSERTPRKHSLVA